MSVAGDKGREVRRQGGDLVDYRRALEAVVITMDSAKRLKVMSFELRRQYISSILRHSFGFVFHILTSLK